LKKILVISDTHINSTVSLCKPSVNLDDGQEVKITNAQKWFWDNYLDLLEKVDSYKPDILIVNGDAAVSAVVMCSNLQPVPFPSPRNVNIFMQ
jgi:3',5'-cyclic AMP phosphodiesterase CpdA